MHVQKMNKNYVNTKNQKGEQICKEDIAASFTKVIAEAVKSKVSEALSKTGYDKIVLGSETLSCQGHFLLLCLLFFL